MKNLKKSLFAPAVSVAVVVLSFTFAEKNNLPKEYTGKPFHDQKYKAGPQLVPGRVECSRYDTGGEGISYHDSESINKGSGEYNYQEGHCEPGSDYVCHFREKEGVDLSYTKEFLDFNHPNLFTPERWQQFIGWTKDGEWCNYTILVKKTGTYKVGILYSNEPCTFSLAVNYANAGQFRASTKTGSYHTWNKTDSLGTIKLKAGLNLLTLRYNGGSNYAYMDFSLLK